MNNIVDFWPVLKRLLNYGLNMKKPLILGSILLILSSIAEVLSPVLISYFIEINLKINQKYNFLVEIIIWYLTLQIFASVLNYYQDIIFNKISIIIVQNLRYDVMSTTLNLPMKEFDLNPIGQFISKITSDTEIIKELYDTVIATLFRNIILISITLISMFILEWRMASIAILIFPMVLTVMLCYQYYSKPILRKIRIYIANIHNVFNEIINGMNVIQQFNQEQKFKNSIKKISYLHYLTKIEMLKLDGFLLRPLISLFSAIILCSLILLFGFYPVGFFKIGTLYAFITYLGRLNEPLITITAQQSIFQQAIVAGERIFKLIDTPQQKYGTNYSNLKTGEIHIKNVNFSYNLNTTHILKNINLKIISKQFVALVGHTGSGKSTLAKLLIGLYPTTTGSIYLDNRNIKSLHHTVIKNGVFIVPQEPVILDDTVLENITLGKKISKIKLWNILKKVQLLKLVQNMPKGVNSFLGENGNRLSLGEKQLLSIARVLITKPKILILDEATSNVDSDTEKKIINLIPFINKYSTLIIITHKLSTIKNADKIIVFKNGKIIESDTHNNLINNHTYYKSMYYDQSNSNRKK